MDGPSMDLAPLSSNFQISIRRGRATQLAFPPRVKEFADHDRIIVTGSMLSKGWRSYLVAPSKLALIARRAVRAQLQKKSFTEKDADHLMMLMMLESGMTFELGLRGQQLLLPKEISGGLRSGKAWCLPFRDYAVITTNSEEAGIYSGRQIRKADRNAHI